MSSSIGYYMYTVCLQMSRLIVRIFTSEFAPVLLVKSTVWNYLVLDDFNNNGKVVEWLDARTNIRRCEFESR